MKNESAKKKKPLPKRQKKFVENMANPRIKTQTEAYQKAYNCNIETARANASRLLTNANISEAIIARKKRALAFYDVTPEEVIGSAVFQMRSSIADVLDEKGSFDFEKATATGAVDLIKKHKETIRTIRNENETEIIKTVEIEMLTNQDGRKEVASYIFDKVPNYQINIILTDDDKAKELFKAMIEQHGWTPEETIEGVKELFPEIDETKLLSE